MCLTRFRFHFSKPSFSRQLLFAPSDPLAIFPQDNLESPAHNTPGGVLTKGTQLCINLWGLLTSVPSWCRLVPWTVKDPELLTLIYILPHLAELRICIHLSTVEMSCVLNHAQLYRNTEHAFKFTTVIISHLLGLGRWRLLISVPIALSIYVLFCHLLPPPLPWFPSSFRVFGSWRNPRNPGPLGAIWMQSSPKGMLAW